MKQSKGFRMTDTDLAVIKKISETGVQSYKNLKATVLSGYNPKWIWVILKRLVQQGWLLEYRGDRGVMLGWRLNPRDYKVRCFLNQATPNSTARAPVYKTSFEHDQMVDQVLARLSEAKAVVGKTPEHVLRAETAKRFWYLSELERKEKTLAVPDALLELQVKGTRVKAALELELSRKAKARIRKKLEHYILSPEIPFTFYILKGRTLFDEFQALYREVLEKSVLVKFAPRKNGIYFSELVDVLENGIHAKFVGLENSFTLAELEPEAAKTPK